MGEEGVVDGIPVRVREVVHCKLRVFMSDDGSVLFWLNGEVLFVYQFGYTGREGGRVVEDVVCKQLDGEGGGG